MQYCALCGSIGDQNATSRVGHGFVCICAGTGYGCSVSENDCYRNSNWARKQQQQRQTTTTTMASGRRRIRCASCACASMWVMMCDCWWPLFRRVQFYFSIFFFFILITINYYSSWCMCAAGTMHVLRSFLRQLTCAHRAHTIAGPPLTHTAYPTPATLCASAGVSVCVCVA